MQAHEAGRAHRKFESYNDHASEMEKASTEACGQQNTGPFIGECVP
jgi:hypothetical protein